MEEPRRLIDSDANTLGTRLLKAGRTEAPPDRSLVRALAVAAAVSTATTGATTATAAAATATLTMFAKWIGVGLLAGGAVLGVSHATKLATIWKGEPQTLSSTVAFAPASGQQQVAAAPLGSMQAEPGPTAASAPELTAEAVPTGKPGVTKPTETPALAPTLNQGPVSALASSATQSESDPSTALTGAETRAGQEKTDLGQQIAVIDEARSAVARADAAGALAVIARYRRDFPRGHFGPEATALEVEALALRGDRAGARTIAERFLAAHPESPLTKRVRSAAGL